MADQMQRFRPERPPHDNMMKEAMLETHFTKGQSLAPAIVACCLYFVGVAGGLANMIYTKFMWYDVVVISAAFRCVAYGTRAGYLTHWSAAKYGVFLAFTNAGYGANLAALYLTASSWCGQAVLLAMPAAEQRFWRIACACLVAPIIAFGPILGVIAAGYLFGDLTPHGMSVGTRLRQIATWGLWGCTMAFSLISARLWLAAAASARPRKQVSPAVSKSDAAPLGRRSQQLIGVLCLLSLIMQIRALSNVALLYPSKAFLGQDRYWYCLNALPELIVLYIMVAPTLLARIGLRWPKPAADSREKGAAESAAAGGKDGSPAIESA